MVRGPRTGITEAVSLSALDLWKGVGAVAARSAARGPRSYDGLARSPDIALVCRLLTSFLYEIFMGLS